MAGDETARLHLYERARDAWGPEAADTLMSALPRDADRFATKDDIIVLEANLRTVEATLRGEIKAGNAEVIRTLMFGLIASNATLVGLVFAAVKLA